MIYAISGSEGFIGTALCNRLRKIGEEVVPIRRFQMSSVESLAAFLDAKNIDTVIHLAAYGNHYNQQEHKEIFRVNVLYTLNMLKAAQGRKFYNFSTSSVTLKKKTLYSISKACGEELVKIHSNAVNIRPYSVYGPGEAEHRFVPTVIRSLRTGEKIRVDENAVHDWIYIEDAITGLLAGAQELGTGEQHTNLEVVKLLEEISGKKVNYVPGHLRSYDTDSWCCKNGITHRSLRRGLEETYSYYK